MVLGSWGKLIFEVSSQKMLTFTGLSETVGASYAEHKLIGAKPRMQFMGAALSGVELTIEVRADLGVKPRELIERLRGLCGQGTAEYLVINGRPVGENPYVITSMGAEWGAVYSRGELINAKVSLVFKEYP